MANLDAPRFEFIAHALNADGPFRPTVTHDGTGRAIATGASYLVRYPRESDEKYARRCELAWYASPLAQACSRFTGYLSTRPVVRNAPLHFPVEGLRRGHVNNPQAAFKRSFFCQRALARTCSANDQFSHATSLTCHRSKTFLLSEHRAVAGAYCALFRSLLP